MLPMSRYQNTPSRRRFLLAASVTAVSCLGAGQAVAAPNDSITIQANGNNDLVRVRMEMEVKGNVNVPSDPLVSRESKVTLPTNSKAVLDYEERYRRPEGADSTAFVSAIERYYHTATSKGELNRTKVDIQLRDSVRQTHVRRDSFPETVYSVDDYFTQDELALVRVPVASSAVDQLLPSTAISEGEKYQPNEQALSSFLNLSSIESSTVVFEVKEITTDLVKFQFKGRIEGSVEGVPTTIDAVGKLNYDRDSGTCNWLAAGLHERREISKSEPGFDVAATIKMVRHPLPKTVALPAKPAKMSITQAVPADRLYVELQSKGVGVATMMDRRWRMMSDLSGNAMLRMIENDRSIAQCNIRPLARLEAGKQWTLEAFQRDVQQALGNELNDLLEANEQVSAQGLRVLRVVAQGAVEGVPIQWIMLHFSDDSGRRVQATFTMDNKSVTPFMASDAQFVDSLRLLGSDGAEAVAKDSADTEVASKPNSAKSNRSGSDEVQSASDIR